MRREHVRDLLRLEGELSRIVHVLETAAPAPAEVRTGGGNAMGRRLLHRFDRAAAKTRARLIEANTDLVAGHPSWHEHDVTVDPADAFAAESQVVDGQKNGLATSGPSHGTPL